MLPYLHFYNTFVSYLLNTMTSWFDQYQASSVVYAQHCGEHVIVTPAPLCVYVQHCGVSVVEVLWSSLWHLKLPICLLKLGICCTYILVNAVYPLSFGSTLWIFSPFIV